MTSFRWVVLGLILGAGFMVRIHDLGREGYWYDEVVTARVTRLGLTDMLQNRSINQNPPLYNALMRPWASVFGNAEAALRFPSVLFGVAAIGMLYVVGKRLFDQAVGITAAAFLAFSGMHVHFSQEARSYSLVVLLHIVVVYFFWRAAGEGAGWMQAGLVLSAAALLFAHYAGSYMLLGLNVAYAALWASRGRALLLRPRRWILLQGAIGLIFAPWVAIAMRSFRGIQQGFWIPAPTTRLVHLTFSTYAGSSAAVFLFASLVAVSVSRLALAPAEAGVVAPERRDASLVAAAWLVFPLSVPLLISALSAPVFFPRYTIGALPAFLLLAAVGASQLRFTLKITALAAALAFSAFGVYADLGSVTRDQWREAASLIETQARRGDAVLVSPGYSTPALDFYLDRTDLSVVPLMTASAASAASAPLASELEKAVAGRSRVWLVFPPGTGGALRLALDREFREAYSRPFHGVTVVLSIRRAGRGAGEDHPDRVEF